MQRIGMSTQMYCLHKRILVMEQNGMECLTPSLLFGSYFLWTLWHMDFVCPKIIKSDSHFHLNASYAVPSYTVVAPKFTRPLYLANICCIQQHTCRQTTTELSRKYSRIVLSVSIRCALHTLSYVQKCIQIGVVYSTQTIISRIYSS